MLTSHQALLASEELASVPFLILGNKIDIGRATSEEDLRDQLGLFETYGKDARVRDPNVRPIELYMCSVVRKIGYGDGELLLLLLSTSSQYPFTTIMLSSGFKWLAQFL
jgi:hypothetical protein